ncbi:unnamed protein product [Oikopleura dioica]|uniref:Uncharacterized protein n=1 Tax=Oikopleura dioica TaxID=34765 RepID=E4Y3B9_OIKDI|nr:unnamed protein product [Oikopleura dioica]
MQIFVNLGHYRQREGQNPRQRRHSTRPAATYLRRQAA